MKQYQVQITRTAKQDLKKIVSYIGTQLQERGTAQKLYRAIREGVSQLDHMPERYPLYEDDPWYGYGLRKLLVMSLGLCQAHDPFADGFAELSINLNEADREVRERLNNCLDAI